MAKRGQKPQSIRSKPVSIRDVAEASGVSLTTVSLILNNGDARISKPTRERVLDAISKLGYRPNRLAQGLQNRRSNILAILVPELGHIFADPYFGELISGVYDFASRNGYEILLKAAGATFIRQRRFLDLFDRCFIDGMLFMGSTDKHGFLRHFRDRKRPLIVVNNVRSDIDYVVADYAQAARLVAEHLTSLGHRAIGMIHAGSEIETARQLKTSFIEHLAGLDVHLGPEDLEDGFFSEDAGARATEALLRRRPKLTAIFTSNDKMAAGAIHKLRAMGRRVPEDVSVVGCDDIHHARFVTPALTTVRTPLYELGRRSAQKLIDQLRGQEGECQETMPVELVLRESTAPAPSR